MTSDDEVGYQKPLEKSRFKKVNRVIAKAARRHQKPEDRSERGAAGADSVHEGASAMKISKQRAIVKTLIAKTLKGDARAATTLTSMMYRVLDLRRDRGRGRTPGCGREGGLSGA